MYSCKVITISMPVEMLEQVDEAAAATYQSRSNFIRMAIVEKFGAKSQYELAARRAPDMHTTRQLYHLYDFQEEYDQDMADWEAKKPDENQD